MKKELALHLIPTTLFFLLLSLLWLLLGHPWVHIFLAFFGFFLGAFFLDIDHLLYWYYLKPDRPESVKARSLLKNKKIKLCLAHLALHHREHDSLIFHHYFFQAILFVLAFFIITSTSTIFGKTFIFSIYLHLLSDILNDFRKRPDHLKTWLFARTGLKISVRLLPPYCLFYSLPLLPFFYLIVKTI